MAASRQRFGNTPEARLNSNRDSNSSASAYLDSEKSTTVVNLSELFWIVLIAANVLLFIAVDLNYHSFPKPIHGKDVPAAQQSSTFIESNARQFMDDLCKHGTRHMGSHANEVVAVKAITDEVNKIKSEATGVHKIEMDIQQPKGCFNLNFIGNFTSCYVNVKNLLVRISPTSGFNSALLVNCHYDSAISSPGKVTGC